MAKKPSEQSKAHWIQEFVAAYDELEGKLPVVQQDNFLRIGSRCINLNTVIHIEFGPDLKTQSEDQQPWVTFWFGSPFSYTAPPQEDEFIGVEPSSSKSQSSKDCGHWYITYRNELADRLRVFFGYKSFEQK